jgi:hypothetical protein
VLRDGLKNHTLDSVLFPPNPTRDAPQLLSALNRVFPIAPGHHLFGPVVEIEWGTPTLITMQLGVVLEVGARLRLLVVGQVEAVLPRRDQDLLRIKMDAVGILDFDQGTASLDAVLYESRLLKKFVLTGGMAMRLKWKGAPSFALAVGGLHHAFNPPANFPRLDRIAINLSAGDNPRITCEAYFAVTSNTVQFGARANLVASAHGFTIDGEIGFDVLIQLNPFHFLAEFHASIQLKRGSRNLFKVSVKGALEGRGRCAHEARRRSRFCGGTFRSALTRRSSKARRHRRRPRSMCSANWPPRSATGAIGKKRCPLANAASSPYASCRYRTKCGSIRSAGSASSRRSCR